MPRNILFVVYPDVSLLDLAGPQGVFWVSPLRARARLAGYRCHTASLGGGAVQSVEGTMMHVESLETFDLRLVDTVVVPGSPKIIDVAQESASLIAWLHDAPGKVRRVASVCTGAFLLGFAGLLDDKPCHHPLGDARPLPPAVSQRGPGRRRHLRSAAASLDLGRRHHRHRPARSPWWRPTMATRWR